MLNKNNLLMHFQNDYDFIHKINGWCEQARYGKIVSTDFLDLRQIEILLALFKKEQITNYFIHNPFVNNFRATVSINSSVANTIVIGAPQNPKQIITHSAIIGYLFNELHLDQKVIGDLYVSETMIYLSIVQKISPVFLLAPLICQNIALTFSEITQPIEIIYQFDVFNKVVSSLRLDNIISAICGYPRSKAQEFLQKHNVFVNFSEINSKTFQIACDNIISIRKFGRFKINAIIALKSTNFRIEIAKFK